MSDGTAIQELRADIAKLDTEIDFQRELLKKLEHDRSVKQRQLNSTLDPVARLPLELSSNIFLQSLPLFQKPGDPSVPILLLNICNAWTDIALSTPSLWAAIHIVFPGGLFPSTRCLKTLVPIWLRRAHNRPLSISLSGANFDYDVVSVIWSHAQQLKHLEMSDMNSDELDYIPLWEETIPGSFPSLQTLTTGNEFFPHHILDLLRLAPNLIECSLEAHMGIHVDEILVFPKLRRLTFGKRGLSPLSDCEILDHLSLPRLESLLVNVKPDTLFSFLRRSSPPLLELVLGDESDFPLLIKCFHLVPDLRRLEMWFPTAEAVFAGLAESPTLLRHLNALVLHVTEDDISDSFWAALNCAFFARRAEFQLAESPTLLRHLNALVLHVTEDDISDSFWAALNCAFFARRAEFQLVQITVPNRLPDSKMPSPDIIAAFRALAVNGVQIQLGLTRQIWHGVGRRDWNHTFA